MVEEMAERMEDGFGFAMGEEGGASAEGQSESAAHEAEMGRPNAREEMAGVEGVHPGATALGIAREPVGVEAAEDRGVLVANLVVLDVGMPDGHGRAFDDADGEEALDEVEHAAEDGLDGEVGAQILLLEGVESGALFFGPVGDVPGLHHGGGSLRAAEGEQFVVLAVEAGSVSGGDRGEALAVAPFPPCGRRG